MAIEDFERGGRHQTRPAKTMSENSATQQRALLRTVQGVVASDKADKTIKVVVDYQQQHSKYGKILHRRSVLHVHDEKNVAKEGDLVEVAECRSMSRSKHHRLVRVVKTAPEKAVQVSAEEVMTGKAPEQK